MSSEQATQNLRAACYTLGGRKFTLDTIGEVLAGLYEHEWLTSSPVTLMRETAPGPWHLHAGCVPVPEPASAQYKVTTLARLCGDLPPDELHTCVDDTHAWLPGSEIYALCVLADAHLLTVTWRNEQQASGRALGAAAERRALVDAGLLNDVAVRARAAAEVAPQPAGRRALARVATELARIEQACADLREQSERQSR